MTGNCALCAQNIEYDHSEWRNHFGCPTCPENPEYPYEHQPVPVRET